MNKTRVIFFSYQDFKDEKYMIDVVKIIEFNNIFQNLRNKSSLASPKQHPIF